MSIQATFLVSLVISADESAIFSGASIEEFTADLARLQGCGDSAEGRTRNGVDGTGVASIRLKYRDLALPFAVGVLSDIEHPDLATLRAASFVLHQELWEADSLLSGGLEWLPGFIYDNSAEYTSYVFSELFEEGVVPGDEFSPMLDDMDARIRRLAVRVAISAFATDFLTDVSVIDPDVRVRADAALGLVAHGEVEIYSEICAVETVEFRELAC